MVSLFCNQLIIKLAKNCPSNFRHFFFFVVHSLCRVDLSETHYQFYLRRVDRHRIPPYTLKPSFPSSFSLSLSCRLTDIPENIHVGKRITVLLVSSLTGLDFTKEENMLFESIKMYVLALINPNQSNRRQAIQ